MDWMDNELQRSVVEGHPYLRVSHSVPHMRVSRPRAENIFKQRRVRGDWQLVKKPKSSEWYGPKHGDNVGVGEYGESP
ncbi:hypothetical protein GCM10025794_33750 [Massilia kyonggiensis]